MSKHLGQPVTVTPEKEAEYVPPTFVYFQVHNATVTAKVSQPKRLKMHGSYEPTSFSTDDPAKLWLVAQNLCKEHNLPLDYFNLKLPEQGGKRLDKPTIQWIWGKPRFNFCPPNEGKKRGRAAAEKVVIR